RFEKVFGLRGLDLDLEVERVNPSMGAPETALLRQINRRVNASIEPAHYRPLVRELLAHHTLSKRRDSPRLSLPEEMWAWAKGLSEQWVAYLRDRGVDVVGDLDDLVPVGDPPLFSDPDQPELEAINQASLDAIEALLLEGVRLRESEEGLQEQVRELEEALR